MSKKTRENDRPKCQIIGFGKYSLYRFVYDTLLLIYLTTEQENGCSTYIKTGKIEEKAWSKEFLIISVLIDSVKFLNVSHYLVFHDAINCGLSTIKIALDLRMKYL